MKKNINILLLLFVLKSLTAQDFNYLGNNLFKNFSIQWENKSDSVQQLTLKQGQLLVSRDDEFPSFVLAKDYQFIFEPKSSMVEKITAYALKNEVFPDSGVIYALFLNDYPTNASYLKDLEERNLWGNKAQLSLWNTLYEKSYTIDKKYIYTFNQKMVYESNKPAQICVLALIDTTIVDTLIANKTVGSGEYMLKFKQNVFSDVKGEKEIKIIDSEGVVLFNSGYKIVNPDSLSIYFTCKFKSDRPYRKTTLKVYNKQNVCVNTVFVNRTIPSGSNIFATSFTYYGLPNDSLTVKLEMANGKVLKEETTSYAKSQALFEKGKIGEKYLKIKHKYTSKRYEKRALCVIEDINGEQLALIFENKNIHSGINKIDYSFKHDLNEGDTVFLIVRLPSGKVIEKQNLTIE